MPANPIVDMEHLARYTGGDTALNAEVLRLFDSQATELVGQLQSILDARDAKEWKLVTHTLKGAARGIGAWGFADAAAALEPLDLNADGDNAQAGIGVLQVRADAVASFIRDYISPKEKGLAQFFRRSPAQFSRYGRPGGGSDQGALSRRLHFQPNLGPCVSGPSHLLMPLGLGLLDARENRIRRLYVSHDKTTSLGSAPIQ